MNTTQTTEATDLATVMAWISDQKWSDFAQSLAEQFARKGTLSEKQEAAARKMFAKAAARPAKAPVADAPHGLHVRENGEIVRVLNTRNSGQKVAKRLVHDSYGDWSWEYLGKRGLAGLSTETLMSAEQAMAWGQKYLRCVACFAELTDKRSMAAGYGETCSRNHGWSYPTTAEAIDILAMREAGAVAEG